MSIPFAVLDAGLRLLQTDAAFSKAPRHRDAGGERQRLDQVVADMASIRPLLESALQQVGTVRTLEASPDLRSRR